MVQALAGICFLTLFGTSLAVGMRLLSLARRTRQISELVLGLSLVLMMGIAYPLMILARNEELIGLVSAGILMVVGSAALNASIFLIFLFTWKVFRPDAGWARALAFGCVPLFALHVLAVAYLVTTRGGIGAALAETNRSGLLVLALDGVAYAWTAVESWRYHTLLRRRLSLGLADPVLCNRFLLWALMASVTVFGVLANMAFLAGDVDVLRTPLAVLVTAGTGLCQAALLYLTFLAPARYTDAIRRRANTAAREI
jgi:hypothetical protein